MAHGNRRNSKKGRRTIQAPSTRSVETIEVSAPAPRSIAPVESKPAAAETVARPTEWKNGVGTPVEQQRSRNGHAAPAEAEVAVETPIEAEPVEADEAVEEVAQPVVADEEVFSEAPEDEQVAEAVPPREPIVVEAEFVVEPVIEPAASEPEIFNGQEFEREAPIPEDIPQALQVEAPPVSQTLAVYNPNVSLVREFAKGTAHVAVPSWMFLATGAVTIAYLVQAVGGVIVDKFPLYAHGVKLTGGILQAILVLFALLAALQGMYRTFVLPKRSEPRVGIVLWPYGNGKGRQ